MSLALAVSLCVLWTVICVSFLTRFRQVASRRPVLQRCECLCPQQARRGRAAR